MSKQVSDEYADTTQQESVDDQQESMDDNASQDDARTNLSTRYRQSSGKMWQLWGEKKSIPATYVSSVEG